MTELQGNNIELHGNPAPLAGRPAADDAGAARNVLIVSTVEQPAATLGRHIGPDDTIKVVVPVVRQGFLDWLANDEHAFAEAQEIAEETAADLPGSTIETGAGEADVELAIRDALASFPADEIVVAVHDDEHAGLVESLAIGTVAGRRSIEGVPIRFVVVGST